MKNILLFFILISGFYSCQDLNFAKSLNDLSKDQLKTISDDLISGYGSKLKYVKTVPNYDGGTSLLYYSSDIPESKIIEDSKNEYCSLCTEVRFKSYSKESNKDLNIAGTERYKFVSIEGNYLDLYQWWIKHFAPSESKESLLKSEKRYVKSDNPAINIRFTKTVDVWEITNLY